ncbi:hypothetical protein BC938DRAFT_471958 [Jimgerdemannia flammicorona]|uniref:Uncharacterized protein n=1 Tax=Jimgerdemannia flammicorona TaxID=994334 RepID=A0A433Q706_9FUNG|nr:hypothetical protein BC938DRAFT_471958 [Jimgerdemannia flammicorona]
MVKLQEHESRGSNPVAMTGARIIHLGVVKKGEVLSWQSESQGRSTGCAGRMRKSTTTIALVAQKPRTEGEAEDAGKFWIKRARKQGKEAREPDAEKGH